MLRHHRAERQAESIVLSRGVNVMHRSITRFVVTTLAAALSSQGIGAFPAPPAQEPAKEIIKKAIEAHGGAANLRKFPGIKTTAKGKMTILNMEIDIENEETILLPDQFKNVMKMDVLGQKIEVVQIFNAGKGKLTANGMAAPLKDESTKEMKNGMDFHAATELHPLLDDKTFDLSMIDKPEKDGDRDVVGVLAKTKDKHEIKLFFDAKSFVLVKAERKGLDFEEKAVDQQVLFQDFKKIDGILRPMKQELHFDGKKVMSLEVVEFKHLEKIDKKEFDISD
jgi:hypothetical protein